MALTFDKSTIERLNGSSFSDGNRVALLYKERKSFDAIFDAIHQAKQFICLQFYIFRNDETGMEMAAILRKKAKKGVRIYILYDHFGSLWTPKDFWDSLKSSGIEIRVSRPFHWSSPFYYAHRDHRKLIIIDGVKAFTGGLNIANEYRGFHLRSRKRGWRDTGIMVEGPVVSELLRTFRTAWQRWRGRTVWPADLLLTELHGRRPDDGLPVIPIFASSAKGRRKMRKLLYYSINHAKESILLTTAYFTPSRRMLDALEEAVGRGVTVKLLLPGISDVPAVLYAGRAFFTRLLKRGVKIYNYQGEVLHAKSYVFDGCWSIIGSANLDFLSLRWNDEGNVGILDAGFGKRMICIFEEDLKNSVEIREEEWRNRPLLERILEWVFALFKRRL